MCPILVFLHNLHCLFLTFSSISTFVILPTHILNINLTQHIENLNPYTTLIGYPCMILSHKVQLIALQVVSCYWYLFWKSIPPKNSIFIGFYFWFLCDNFYIFLFYFWGMRSKIWWSLKLNTLPCWCFPALSKFFSSFHLFYMLGGFFNISMTFYLLDT